MNWSRTGAAANSQPIYSALYKERKPCKLLEMKVRPRAMVECGSSIIWKRNVMSDLLCIKSTDQMDTFSLMEETTQVYIVRSCINLLVNRQSDDDILSWLLLL